MGVRYAPQELLFSKFCVDAWLPDHGVVVQFDGDYWHGNPDRFPVLDARQARRRKMDESQDAYMRTSGLRVIRIWETTIKSAPEVARARILAAIGSPEAAAEANETAPTGAQLALL